MNAGWIAVVFLGRQPNPFVVEVGIEAVAQGDVCDGGTGFRTLLNDLSLERFAVGTALRAHGKIRLMGHGLRRRCREGVLAGRILLNYVVWGQRKCFGPTLERDPQRRLGNSAR
uniref:Uncharacterized protein n=1 Tax=Klebsiella pneumoniae TaxID=573 RepID=A0A8B0ST70_KLEPN|nr:hypothetical protein [Klebsiella pneumoniae]